MAQALGASIAGSEVATVIVDADSGAIVARNAVRLETATPEFAADMIEQLAATAPFDIEARAVAVHNPDWVDPLLRRLAALTEAEWRVSEAPVAMAYLPAAQHNAYRGVVNVVSIDKGGALTPGLSVATVDGSDNGVVGVAPAVPAGTEPVTTLGGAQLLSHSLARAGAESAGVLLLGGGAADEGVLASVEYQSGLAVALTDEPVTALAHGAALLALNPPATPVKKTNWPVLGVAAVMILALAAIVITIVVMVVGDGDDATPRPADSTSSVNDTTEDTVPVAPPSAPPATTTTTTTTAPPPPPTTYYPPPVYTTTRQRPTSTTTRPPVTTTPPPTTTSEAPPPVTTPPPKPPPTDDIPTYSQPELGG